MQGYFGHGHDCPLFKSPSTYADFRKEKIRRNQTNDRKVTDSLLANRWRVGIVWECALRGKNKNIERLMQNLSDWLQSGVSFFEERG